MFTKIIDAVSWFYSKLLGLLFLLFGVGLFVGLCYWEGNKMIQEMSWPSSKATIESMERSGSDLLLHLSVIEKDGTTRSKDVHYRLSRSEESDGYSMPIHLYAGATITVLYQEGDPNRPQIAWPIWGFLVGLLFSLGFAFIGFLVLNDRASARFKKFIRWNTPKDNL